MSLPSKVGPYQVLRQLGRGGMGVVYAVQDPLAPRALALKLILDASADPIALARFEREAELLARVHHRSVVRVHKVGRLPEGPFILQALVEGEGLHAVCARGLEPRRAAAIARELACALAAVHAQGILHRDLKPANVVVQPDGIPVLLDFGVAGDAAADRLTRTGALVGTMAYMAPEQAEGARVRPLDARTDVYGLGALLYEMLTDRPPFQGGGLQVLKDVLERDPPWPIELRDVPPALDAIVRRAMAKSPADRYPDAAALRDDLERFLAERRTTPSLQRRGGRGRAGLAIVAGVVVLVVLVAILVAILAERAASRSPSTGAGDGRPTGDGAATTPAPAPSAAPPTPTQAPPAAAEPLWRLAAGDVLDWSFDVEESDDYAQLAVGGELRARVTSLGPERVELEVAFVSLRIGVGSRASGVGSPFDSREPQPGHPLALVANAVGHAFTASLDPRTGALEARGLDRILKRVPINHLGAIPMVDARTTRSAVRILLGDAFMSRMLAGALHVRSATVPWREVQGAHELAPPEPIPPILPSVIDDGSRRSPSTRAVVTGQARYAAGRFVEGEVTQVEERERRGSARTRWTLRAAP